MSWSGSYAPPDPADRLRAAWQRQSESDYIFSFWTALGWTLLSCGIFSFYVTYQLVRRSRDHNLRRLELLEAANEAAWRRAVGDGRGDELKPRFERVAASLAWMRHLTGEFRDPGLWTVIVVVGGGIAQIILYWLLDTDLVRHSAAEADAERQLVAVYHELGVPVGHLVSFSEPKAAHNYWMRVLALVASCGLYSLWWLYDIMEEGNANFRQGALWENAFVRVTGAVA